MKRKKLTKNDWRRIESCIISVIADRAKAIQSELDSYNTQMFWAIAEEMVDDFELLDKVQELCGEKDA